MASILGFTGIVITTLIALIAAIALDWALLNGIFLLMRPATAQRPARCNSSAARN